MTDVPRKRCKIAAAHFHVSKVLCLSLGCKAVVMLTVFVMALPIINMFCLLAGAWQMRSKEPDTEAAWQLLG